MQNTDRRSEDRRGLSFDERSEMFKALGNKTRLEIFEKIMTNGIDSSGKSVEMCITDVASMFNYSLPTISSHLEILKKAGLLSSHKDGKKIFVNIDIEKYKKLSKSLNNIISTYENKHLGNN